MRRMDIRNDEEAMEAVRLLKQKGYTADEVSDSITNLCPHDRLDEDGACRSCGRDCR